MRFAPLLAALAVLSAGVAPALAQGPATMQFRSDDPAALQSIRDARSTLPHFWAAMADGKGESYRLKVAFNAPDASQEEIWVEAVRRDGARYRGRLYNEPLNLPGKQKGSEVSFGDAEIVDWGYVQGGRLWGAYSMRLMAGRLEGADADYWNNFLSSTPVPAGTN